MVEGARRQVGLAAELAEWWEDLWQRDIGSQVVLVAVPAGWGRSTVLDRFAAGIDARDDALVTLTVRIEGKALQALETAGLRSQALARTLQMQVLRADLGEAAEQHRAVELLGLDESAGRAQLGLGVAGLFFSGLTAGVSFLLAGLAAGAAGNAWDDSPAGQDGALARTARAVAAVSVESPVTVIVDDADCLDVDLAVTMVENLTTRQDSQVLVIAVVGPGSVLPGAIRSRVRHGLTSGLVHNAEADPDMGYESRLELARQLRPNLPDASARRIAQRTTAFAEVFTVAAAPRLTEIGPGEDADAAQALVDAAASGRLTRPVPSPEATVIAWAGGLMHTRQACRALGILGAHREEGDQDVRRWESLLRLADPAAPRLADQVATGLTAAQRRDMATALLDEALALAHDSGASLIDKVAALQAAHQVRSSLAAPGQLPRAQRELVTALEALGDYAAALEVAATALDEWPHGAGDVDEREALAAAVIRLSHTTQRTPTSPLAQQLIAEAAERGAATGLEARIWAAIALLDTPGQREAALTLAHDAAADLEARSDLGSAGYRWRLLLAYHVGRAGLADLTARLLGPLDTSADPDVQRSAAIVRRAVDGPGADIRLQNILLETELSTLPLGADDDQLRIRHALAANYTALGDYRQALAHGKQELALRTCVQGPLHPATLETRHDIATRTGQSGDTAGALRQSRELLPDVEQVFGPRHLGTLTARADIAYWTGQSGDAAAALRLYQDLWPDEDQALGPRHPAVLTTRANIANWTGHAGDAAEARRLHQALVPDMEQILGRLDPQTLAARGNLAHWTGECGDRPEALRLYLDLLSDRNQVFGPRHPETLVTRSNVARLAGECGNPVAALTTFQALLADIDQVFGRLHPYTLNARSQVASWTGHSGDVAEALRLYRALLPDMEQALGPRHPTTLATRGNMAHWTGESGDVAGALRLYRALLPDVEQVLGPRHPVTLATSASIAELSGETAAVEPD